MITSISNERVKFARSLRGRRARREAGAFVIEGVRLVEEAARAGVEMLLVLYDPVALSGDPRAEALLAALPPRALLEVAPHVLRAAANTMTPQGIVTVVPLPPPPRSVTGRLLLVLDGLQDPGNLGTIMRSADASGVRTVITVAGTVDPFSPKVVRAAMGAHFRLALWADRTWSEINGLTAGYVRLVAATADGRPYDEIDWLRPSALIVGSEAEGVSDEAEAMAHGRVTIPMAGPTESLNAAVAASIILFEA